MRSSAWPDGRRLAALCLGAVVAAAGLDGAAAELVVLRAAADTTLFFAAPGSNLGSSDSMAVGSTGHDQAGRGLLRFDVAGALPAGVTVTGASLEFVITRSPPTAVGSAFELHRMLGPWSEGRGTGSLGEAARAGESTWNHRVHPEVPWAAPGGEPGTDFSASPSGRVDVAGDGRYTISGSGLVADVTAWLAAPASNHGWLLKSDKEAEAFTARRVGTRESAAAVATLTLEFGTARRPVIRRWGRVEDRFELEFLGEAGNMYEVQYRDASGSDAAWQVLTNVVVKLVPVNPVVSEPLSAAVARYYRVADVGDVD